MLKTVSQLILESNNRSVKYGCLMMFVDIDVDKIVGMIDPIDINEAEGGIETEPHVTLLYGFHETVDPQSVLKMVQRKLDMKNCKNLALNRVSIFKNDGFDVLKFDIMEGEIYKVNKMVAKNFQHTTTHPIYHAHMTIAYLMPGTGDKYVKQLSGMKMTASPKTLVYSDKNKNKTVYEISAAS